jgi:hypothetical protein
LILGLLGIMLFAISGVAAQEPEEEVIQIPLIGDCLRVNPGAEDTVIVGEEPCPVSPSDLCVFVAPGEGTCGCGFAGFPECTPEDFAELYRICWVYHGVMPICDITLTH